MDLRKFQRSGKVGRIDVDLKVENDKTIGEIRIPTSLNRSETALIAATFENCNKDRTTRCNNKSTKNRRYKKNKSTTNIGKS